MKKLFTIGMDMEAVSTKTKITELVFHGLYLIFFASLIFSLRAISSISISAILMAAIVTNPSRLRSIFSNQLFNYFLLACTLFLILQAIALFYTADLSNGWSNIRIKSGILITALAVYLTPYLDKSTVKKLLYHYCILLLAACLYCLLYATVNYQRSGNMSLFFYHQLVSPFVQHAIYFSILVMIGLMFLVEQLHENGRDLPKSILAIFILFLSGFLFLLSSKLIISFFILYLLLLCFNVIRKKGMHRWSVAIFSAVLLLPVTLVFTSKNPVSKRFDEILKGDIAIINRDNFKQSDYFNGLQFRLLQWKFVPEILQERKSWWTGVSPGDAQRRLNEKYISKNMYSGTVARGDRGYLVYNTHNQFLQALLQTGIIGLSVMIAVCILLIGWTRSCKDPLLNLVTLMLLLWLLTEAAFETQYGILIFIFFPVFLGARNNDRSAPKANL